MKSSSRTIFSRLALLALLAASPFLLNDVQAFGGKPGGPFSNGTYFPNDGTFSAVLRGEDCIGTLQFSTSNTGSSGNAVIYNAGDTYIGNSRGSFNASSDKITVQFQASAAGQGQNSVSINQIIDLGDIEITTTTVRPDGTIVTTESKTPQRSVQPVTQINYFDSLYCDGAFICKTSNDFPTQKFSGNGQVEFQTLIFTGDTPFLDAGKKDISISGVRLSNVAVQFETAEVTPPSVSELSVLVQ
jgi:hypothetical protein